MFFKKHLNIFILLNIFLIVESIINPVGEFCLNDDWAYAASVKTLLSKGVFETVDKSTNQKVSIQFYKSESLNLEEKE